MADIERLIADAMTTWKSGAMKPSRKTYGEVRDGEVCGCLMTAAVACGNPGLIKAIKDDDEEDIVEFVVETAKNRYGVGEWERAAIIGGFDDLPPAASPKLDLSIYAKAQEAARAVGLPIASGANL